MSTETVQVPSPISYTLHGADRLRWTFAVQQRARRGLAVLPLVLLSATWPAIRLARDSHERTLALALLGVLVLAVIAGAVWLALAVRRSETIGLTFEPKGIDFTRNGETERVAWYAIEEASSFKRFIAIERRDDSRPIFIPRTSPVLDDRLWSYLELRLQGTQPQQRYFPAPTRLVNRLDQYLMDRGFA